MAGSLTGFHPVGEVPKLATSRRLLIGPLNTAGQATRWARAVDSFVPDASALSYSFSQSEMDFASDIAVPKAAYSGDERFRREFSDYVFANFTHVIIEGGRSLFGPKPTRLDTYEISRMLDAGIEVALLAHGSDLRIPSRHRTTEEWSLFKYASSETVDRLEVTSRRSERIMNSFPGTRLVSTPDLLDYDPGARWCPVVVDSQQWASNQGVLEQKVPVVAHVPSAGWVKGSQLIDPLLQELHDKGVIEYRRVEGLAHEAMPQVYGDADFVVDQLLTGSYGVAACEAMAAGRVVLGHVSDSTRARVLSAEGGALPIVEITPETIVETIRELIADPEAARSIAAQGPPFVKTVHNGQYSASVLSSYLDSRETVPATWLPAVSGTKVVMVAGNDVVSHSRVLKCAQTVASWGLDVTALGVAGKRHKGDSVLGQLKVKTPVVGTPLSGHRRSLIQHLTPWYSNAEERAAGQRKLDYARRELSGMKGAIRRDAFREGVMAQSTRGRRQRELTFGLARLRVQEAIHRARGLKLSLLHRWKSRRPPTIGVGRRRDLTVMFYRKTGLAHWRRQLKQTLDREAVIGPILDRLKPDLIHVHDVFMIGVAARAAQRRAAMGQPVCVIYDAHEYLPGLAVSSLPTPRTVAAYCDLEAEFIGDADRVITVSEPLAELLKRNHGLTRLPDLVLNAPIDGPVDAKVPHVRELLELDDDVPILVYVGGLNRARGVATAVSGLPQLPGVHLAVVAREGAMTRELAAQAADLGVGDRLHVLPFVAPELVPAYIASATLGISPLLRVGNHDVALTNKFCEYLAAGIPIVSSDTPAQADLIEELDLGTVHRAGDTASFVSAVTAALADRERLTARICDDAELRHRFSWAAQAEVLRDVYTDLLGDLPEAAWTQGATHITHLVTHKDPDQAAGLGG